MAVRSAHASMLEAAIESELSANEAQISALLDIGVKRWEADEAEEKAHPRSLQVRQWSGDSEPKRLLTREEYATIDRLQARATRLSQVQQLFKDDPELMRIVDATIGNQVKAAEQRQQALARVAQRRQTIFSVVFSVLSLIAGWLLSAVSPVSAVAHLAGH